RPVDLRERRRLVRLDIDARGDLPSLPQLSRGIGAGTLRRLAALTLRAGEVLRADRPRLRIRQPRQVTQMHPKPVERGHDSSVLSGRLDTTPIDRRLRQDCAVAARIPNNQLEMKNNQP